MLTASTAQGVQEWELRGKATLAHSLLTKTLYEIGVVGDGGGAVGGWGWGEGSGFGINGRVTAEEVNDPLP